MYTGNIIRLPNNYHNLENNTDLIFIDRVSMLVFPKYDQYNHTSHTWPHHPICSACTSTFKNYGSEFQEHLKKSEQNV